MSLQKNDMINYAAILVIVVSLASIGMELTGFATITDTGVVNVTVETSAGINFTAAFIDFQNGTVGDGASGATLDTENNATVNGTWEPTASGFTLENIGNTNVTLGLSADKNASEYLGGTSPGFRYKVSENETGSCVGNLATTYTEFNSTAVTACPNLPYDDPQDSIFIDIQLYIPSNSEVGNLTATVMATGTF
jgi:hypothetical protein